MKSQFTPNERFDRIFLLKGIDERRTKSGKPYLTLVLGTPDGSFEGRVWDMEMRSLPSLSEGDPVHAEGTVQLYQEKIQLIVETICRAGEPVDPRDLYPAAEMSEAELQGSFREAVGTLRDPSLRTLFKVMEDDDPVWNAFFRSPAAVTMHHARIGGLAEHSLGVCRLALAVASSTPWLDRDLLVAGALLHDIGKVFEYEVAGDFRYTLHGKLLGHISLGASLVEKWIGALPALPERASLELLHIILSHHGQLELGSPRTPATAEALVVHYADDLDAKLDMIRSAGSGEGTEEAFVRGLRRSFQFRNEQGAGLGAQGAEEQGAGLGAQGAEDRSEKTHSTGGETTDSGRGIRDPGSGKRGAGQGEMF